jgi:hypothetical protein
MLLSEKRRLAKRQKVSYGTVADVLRSIREDV